MTPFGQLDCDVAILGGGPAGTTTARLLAQRGISATVLEAGNYSDPSMGQTLSPAINPLLQQLEITTRLKKRGAICRGVASIWGSDSLYKNEYFWTPYGDGWHIERPSFDKELTCLAMNDGVRCMVDVKMHSCDALPQQQWSLRFQVGEVLRCLRCRFIVAATGRVGCFSSSLFGSCRVYDRLIGVAWIGWSSNPYPYTLIEAVSDGWFYASQLSGSRCTVVLMTDSDIYRANRPKQREFWRQQLRQAKHLREVFPDSIKSFPQRIFSAATLLRTPAAGPNWLHVGDSAMSLDPISGKGIYHALLGASHAASAVGDSLRVGRAVRLYEAWVRKCFDGYGSIWRNFYSQETRWRESAFWERRRLMEPLISGRGRVALGRANPIP